jgi:hypothetical protein
MIDKNKPREATLDHSDIDINVLAFYYKTTINKNPDCNKMSCSAKNISANNYSKCNLVLMNLSAVFTKHLHHHSIGQSSNFPNTTR